jgi:hypothetical protein
MEEATMTSNTKHMIAAVAMLALLMPFAAAIAQDTKVVETNTIEVLKVVDKGQSHIIFVHNLTTKEFHKYSEVPDNVVITLNGKPAKLTDLKKGMKFQAMRLEGVAAPTVVTQAEVDAAVETPAPAPAPAPAAAPAPAPEPAPAPAAEPAALPHTASNLPLVGLGGVAFLLAGLVVAGLRRRSN